MSLKTLKSSNKKITSIFGARGAGKSTFLKEHFPSDHLIKLLEDRWESRYLANPNRLVTDLHALPKRPDWVILDEVQKVPKLLDIVHLLSEDE